MVNIPCFAVADDAAVINAEIGAFCFKQGVGQEYLVVKTPGAVAVLPIYEGESGKGWKFDGNREKPTLTPSIAQSRPGPRDKNGEPTRVSLWHGFLTKGVLITC